MLHEALELDGRDAALFNPKTEEYNYKFLGDRQMLACVDAEHAPGVRCTTDGGASECPEAWEMRHMYVVEATPRPERITQALHSKTVIFMDSEIWSEPYVDTYDRKGQLFQSGIGWLIYRDRPVPDAKIAIYPFPRSFAVAGGSVDVQGGIASLCFLPGTETPERECWYINMGAVSRDFFTVQALTRAGK